MPYLEYELEVDDMAAFVDYHVAHDPYTVNRIRKVRWIFTVLMGGIAILAWTRGLTSFAGIYGGLTVCWFVALPTFARWRYRRENLRILRSTNPGLLGRRELNLDQQQLISKSKSSETTLKLSLIERMVDAADYFFIYIGPNQAIVIPKQRILTGDLNAFVSELAQKTST